MITNQTQKKLKRLLTIYLANAKALKAKEAEVETMKSQLVKEFELVKNEFTEGTLLIAGVALISTKQNPARLVWRSTGKGLTPPERDALAQALPNEFVYEDIDVKKLKDAIERGDKEIESKVTFEQVKIEQSSGYTIKPAV